MNPKKDRTDPDDMKIEHSILRKMLGEKHWLSPTLRSLEMGIDEDNLDPDLVKEVFEYREAYGLVELGREPVKKMPGEDDQEIVNISPIDNICVDMISDEAELEEYADTVDEELFGGAEEDFR